MCSSRPTRTTSPSRAAASSRASASWARRSRSSRSSRAAAPTTASRGYQREALGFGSKTMWPATEAFNRSNILADWPTAAAGPVVGRDRGPPRGDAGRRRCRRQAVLAALVVVSPGQHPQRVARRPAGHRRPLDPGRHLHRRRHGRGRGRRPDGPAARRGRAVRLLRRGVDRLPRPARRGLPRLRGRRRAARRRRASDDDAPFDAAPPEITRLEPQKVYLPLGVGGHVDHQLCREVGSCASSRRAAAG